MKYCNPRSLAFFCAALLFGGCTQDNPVDPDGTLTNDRFTIINDEGVLEGEVDYADEDVPIDTSEASPNILAKAAAPISLRLRAQVNPPQSGGLTLQATHITLDGNRAYVSYNFRGDVYLGAVDVFDVSSKTRPRLISRAILNNTDVSALYHSNDRLYLAESTSDTGFAYPAVIEEIELQKGRLTLITRRTGVSSYVATDVKVAFGKVFAVSGSGGPGVGGLTVLDLTTFGEITRDNALDARAVNVYGGMVAVLQGTPARLRVYDASSTAFLKSYFVGGANIPESKSTADIVLTRAFVAGGDEGLKVVDLTNDTVVDSIAAPIVSGLDPNLTVTNAVTVHRDLVFLANGEAGVYVAEADFNLETTPTGPPKLRVRGKMKFGTQQSANFVASKSDLIFVASGLGGLKIVEIQ